VKESAPAIDACSTATIWPSFEKELGHRNLLGSHDYLRRLRRDGIESQKICRFNLFEASHDVEGNIMRASQASAQNELGRLVLRFWLIWASLILGAAHLGPRATRSS
jgi:hypothetical protein